MTRATPPHLRPAYPYTPHAGVRRARLQRRGRSVHHDPLSRLWGVVLPRPHRRRGGRHAGAPTGPGPAWARLLSRPLRLLPAGTAADAPLRPLPPALAGTAV